MSVKIFQHGTVSYNWATIRAAIINDSGFSTVKIKLAHGSNPNSGNINWVFESDMWFVRANLIDNLHFKAWHKFTNLLPDTDYVVEVSYINSSGQKIFSTATFKTRKYPAFIPSGNISSLESLNGRFIRPDNSSKEYLILNEIFMHEVSPALKNKIILKIQTFSKTNTATGNFITSSSMTIPAEVVSHTITDELYLSDPLDDFYHIKKVNLLQNIDSFIFEFDLLFDSSILGLYFRKAAWIEINQSGSNLPQCPLDMTNSEIPTIPPKELEDIDLGELVLKYEV